jgi:hypothetical protein
LIGYCVSLMFWYGYANLVMNPVRPGRVPADAVVMMIVGMVGYPLWMFTLLLTVCGLARAVGDNLMMSEPVTFRRCFAAVRGKVGSIIALGLLIMAMMAVVYVALFFVMFGLILFIGLIGGLIASMHLPQWAIIFLMAVASLAVIAAALFAISFLLARMVFMPQVLMIEGESPGSALGRAFKLGKGNWHRVLAIVLFTYFISFSLLGALSIVTGAILYFAGFIATANLSNPIWNILYTSFRDISGMLSLPIWVISFTLLYFDSRVRKEAYDIELLAREVAPGYVWQAAQPAFAGYYAPRQYVQTGPLGLGGYSQPAPPSQPGPVTLSQPGPPPMPSPMPPFEPTYEPPFEPIQGTPGDQLRARFEQAAQAVSEDRPADGAGHADAAPPASATPAWCKVCGNRPEPGSRFCGRCGSAVQAPGV